MLLTKKGLGLSTCLIQNTCRVSVFLDKKGKQESRRVYGTAVRVEIVRFIEISM